MKLLSYILLILFICFNTGCNTFKKHPDMNDHFPVGYENLCNRANAWGKEEVKKIIKKEPQRIAGWTVTIVEGEDSPYGKAIRNNLSPTGWAKATTRACKTKVVIKWMDFSTLSHEARHYWAYMNGVDVGL